jgi:hypothetical protein
VRSFSSWALINLDEILVAIIKTFAKLTGAWMIHNSLPLSVSCPPSQSSPHGRLTQQQQKQTRSLLSWYTCICIKYGAAVAASLVCIPKTDPLPLSLLGAFQNATGRLWVLAMARETGPSHHHSWRISRVTCVSVYSPLSPRRVNASFSLSVCSIFGARLQSKLQFSQTILLWI